MKRLFTPLLASLFIGMYARADFVKGSQSLALYGGSYSTASDYDFRPGHHEPVAGPGPAFGGQYLYYVKTMPSIAVGADVLSGLSAGRRDSDALAGFDTTARVKSLVGLLIARLSYPTSELRPYIFAGVGAHHSTQEFSAQPQSGVTWSNGGTESRNVIDEHKTSAALAYGIGMDMFPAQSFFIGAEFRAIWLAGLNTGDTAALRSEGFTDDHKRGITQRYVLLHLGWMFK